MSRQKIIFRIGSRSGVVTISRRAPNLCSRDLRRLDRRIGPQATLRSCSSVASPPVIAGHRVMPTAYAPIDGHKAREEWEHYREVRLDLLSVRQELRSGALGLSRSSWMFLFLLLTLVLLQWPRLMMDGTDEDEEQWQVSLVLLCVAMWSTGSLILCCLPRDVICATTSELTPPHVGAASTRVPYMDNLKSLLTMEVITYRCLMCLSDDLSGCNGNAFTIFCAWIVAIHSAFAMPLLFFIAGCSTPASYHRQGVLGFLKERFIRLGVPTAVYALLVGPLQRPLSTTLEEGAGAVDGDAWDPFEPVIGIAWLPNCLLLLSLAYSLIEGAPRPPRDQKARHLPRVETILLVGSSLGAVWGAVRFRTDLLPATLIGGPAEALSLPFCVIYFSAGCTAGYCGWLEGDVPALSRTQYMAARLHALGFMVCLMIFLVYEDSQNGGVFMTPRRESAWRSLGHSLEPLGFETHPITGTAYYSLAGGFSLTMSLSCLHLCSAHLVSASRVTCWLAENSYAAYLVHTSVMLVALESLGRVLYFFGVPFEDECDTDGEPWRHSVVAGFVLTAAITLASSWILAAALRAIPGVRRVL